MSTKIPAGLLYTKNDEWVRQDGDEAVIGITDYAQDSLSDIVYVELPSVGDSFKAGEAFGVVESVKAASDTYMPVSGEVVAVNDAVVDAPEMLNADPYEKGWMVRVKITDAGSLKELMDAAAYETYCAGREH